MNALPNDPQDLLRAARLHGACTRPGGQPHASRGARAGAEHARASVAQARACGLPLLICSSLLLVVCYAVWGMLDGYDLTPTGIPDASDQVDDC